MTTTPAVAPLSAEELDKLEALARAAEADNAWPFNVNAFRKYLTPRNTLALIAQARAAQPKREMPSEMKAAIEEAHNTGATSALLPNGSTVFINYGHDYGDNSHLECTACGGSGHIEDQRARAATVASVEDARDAARYRAWRQVALTGNEKFIEAMQDAMPQEKDEMEAIDWDNAIDAAMSATKEGK